MASRISQKRIIKPVHEIFVLKVNALNLQTLVACKKATTTSVDPDQTASEEAV